MKLKCPVCDKEFDCAPSRLKKAKSTPCCSVECSISFKKEQGLNCTCDFCGKKFHKKDSHMKKNKNHYCSVKCLGEHRKIIYQNENNPNSFCRIPIGAKRLHCGYYWIYLPNHPLSTKSGYIREHRLIAEKYLLNEENSIIINNEYFLSPDYEVHHIDFNKLNNDYTNLQVLTKSEHQKLHSEIKKEALELYKTNL